MKDYYHLLSPADWLALRLHFALVQKHTMRYTMNFNNSLEQSSNLRSSIGQMPTRVDGFQENYSTLIRLYRQFYDTRTNALQ